MRPVLIFILSLLVGLFFSPAQAAGSATFNLAPAPKSVEVGRSFTVDLNINPGGASVDTARAHINFSAGLIEADEFNLSGKLSNASPGNTIDNSSGSISWGGFAVNDQITKLSSFGRITFKAEEVGAATISLVGDSKLVSSGTEVGNPGGFNQIVVKIVASTADPSATLELTSPTHPDQNKWYQSNTVEFKWAASTNKQYTWDFDQNPSTVPTKITTAVNKQIKGVKNGIWYFHLAGQSPVGAHEQVVAHYRVQIDNLKPSPFAPHLEIGDKSALALEFAATDYHSGIASYDVRVNQVENTNVISPFVLKGINVGVNLITVTAYDLAGNSRTGWIKFTQDPDGTVRNTATSDSPISICNTIPWFCINNNLQVGVGLLILLVGLLLALFRRHQSGSKSDTKRRHK